MINSGVKDQFKGLFGMGQDPKALNAPEDPTPGDGTKQRSSRKTKKDDEPIFEEVK